MLKILSKILKTQLPTMYLFLKNIKFHEKWHFIRKENLHEHRNLHHLLLQLIINKHKSLA